MNIEPRILDSVALLKDIPEHKLIKGQVGAIVEVFTNGNYEVEFVETSGKTLAILTLNQDSFLVLHYEGAFIEN